MVEGDGQRNGYLGHRNWAWSLLTCTKCLARDFTKLGGQCHSKRTSSCFQGSTGKKQQQSCGLVLPELGVGH